MGILYDDGIVEDDVGFISDIYYLVESMDEEELLVKLEHSLRKFYE